MWIWRVVTPVTQHNTSSVRHKQHRIQSPGYTKVHLIVTVGGATCLVAQEGAEGAGGHREGPAPLEGRPEWGLERGDPRWPRESLEGTE